jgi:hypothetical protein
MRLALLATVAVLIWTSLAMAASPKLSARDFDRLAHADQAAGLASGLVTQRCRLTNVACIAKATTQESASARRAAAVSEALLLKLSKDRAAEP